MDVHLGDVQVEKTRYSALIQGSSKLESELRCRGITSVWIGGTTTSTCCESTARDAMLLNFRTTMVTDGTADHTEEEHNATLVAFCSKFGDIASSEELIAQMANWTAQAKSA